MATFTLYHGNTEQVINDIVAAGKCLEVYKSSGPKHYLGDGYYFYDDPIQAKFWALMKVTRNLKYLGQPWGVLKCKIEVDDDRIFDLDKRTEQDFFFEEMLNMKLQIESGNLEVEQYRDTYLCNHLANIIGIDLFSKTFPYKDKTGIITPLFSNVRHQTDLPITRHFRTEKQYCLRFEQISDSTKYDCGTIVKRGESNG